MTPLTEPHQYPSFTLVTLKTTGHDGNCINPTASILRLPAWPCFLDQAKQQNPYVRQYNSLWSISIPVVADRDEKKSPHAQTHIWFEDRAFWMAALADEEIVRSDIESVSIKMSSVACVLKCSQAVGFIWQLIHEKVYAYALFFVYGYVHYVCLSSPLLLGCTCLPNTHRN